MSREKSTAEDPEQNGSSLARDWTSRSIDIEV
jgi:hypothetical protein